jgi:hypothetical protein
MFTGDQPTANNPSCDIVLISGLQNVLCLITLKLIRMSNFGFELAVSYVLVFHRFGVYCPVLMCTEM